MFASIFKKIPLLAELHIAVNRCVFKALCGVSENLCPMKNLFSIILGSTTIFVFTLIVIESISCTIVVSKMCNLQTSSFFIHNIGSIVAQDLLYKTLLSLYLIFSIFASTPEPQEDMDDIVSELNLRVTSVLSTQVPVYYSSIPQLPNDFAEGITSKLWCNFMS